MSTGSGSRKLEYHINTRTLYFIGEAYHGVWKYHAGNGTFFWYCSMGNLNNQFVETELWETLKKSDQLEDPADLEALGLTNSWYTHEDYYILRLYPIQGKTRVYVNSVQGQIAREDFTELSWDEVENNGRYWLYMDKTSGYTAIAAKFDNHLDEPPGVAGGDPDLHDYTCPPRSNGPLGNENYDSKCDGYLIDIAFKTTLHFQEDRSLVDYYVDPADEGNTIVIPPGVFSEGHGGHGGH